MSRPSVLVLLASYNGAKWITEQIETILSQSGVTVTLKVSDDGSTDETRAAIARFSIDDRLQILTEQPPTGSAAQNFLSLMQRTPVGCHDFVAFSDQDDLWFPEKLSRACTALVDAGASGYSSSVIAFWPDGREKLLNQSARCTQSDFLFEGGGQGCTFVITANLYIRLQQFLKANLELMSKLHFHDWAIYALARSWNLEWVFDQRPSLKYRQHSANEIGARHGIRGIAKRIRMIRSGWYANQLRLVTALCACASPQNVIIQDWQSLLFNTAMPFRRWRLTRFCIAGGRRRRSDSAVLVIAILIGWLQ
jgi:rhamnosyltransferase